MGERHGSLMARRYGGGRVMAVECWSRDDGLVDFPKVPHHVFGTPTHVMMDIILHASEL
jgi:hypothetical protein